MWVWVNRGPAMNQWTPDWLGKVAVKRRWMELACHNPVTQGNFFNLCCRNTVDRVEKHQRNYKLGCCHQSRCRLVGWILTDCQPTMNMAERSAALALVLAELLLSCSSSLDWHTFEEWVICAFSGIHILETWKYTECQASAPMSVTDTTGENGMFGNLSPPQMSGN